MVDSRVEEEQLESETFCCARKKKIPKSDKHIVKTHG